MSSEIFLPSCVRTFIMSYLQMVNQIQHIYCSYKFRKMNRGTNKIEESLLFHSLIVVSE